MLPSSWSFPRFCLHYLFIQIWMNPSFPNITKGKGGKEGGEGRRKQKILDHHKNLILQFLWVSVTTFLSTINTYLVYMCFCIYRYIYADNAILTLLLKHFHFSSCNQGNQIEEMMACHFLLPIESEKNRKDNSLCWWKYSEMAIVIYCQ